MNKPNTTTPITEKQEALDLLNHLNESPQVSQRTLSEKLGVSLGKVNFLIKELSKKGWLKAKRATKSEHKRIHREDAKSTKENKNIGKKRRKK